MSENLPNIKSKTAVLAIVSAAFFLVVCAFGEGLVANLGENTMCYKYLGGCDAGFFGYDALEHLLFGISAVCVLVWLCKKYPRFSLLSQDKKWKNLFTLVAIVALASVAWEFVECAHDYFRLEVFREPLLSLRLHINNLDQPTNLDTMGDLAFSVGGSIFALLFVEL